MNTLQRWRLVLGKYADNRLQNLNVQEGAANAYGRMDRALEYLYGREYKGRGLREGLTHGSLGPSQLTLVNWLTEVRELFPIETVEIIEKHALDRYGLTELVTDPQTLEHLEPNQELLRALLTLRSHLKGEGKHCPADSIVSIIRRWLTLKILILSEQCAVTLSTTTSSVGNWLSNNCCSLNAIHADCRGILFFALTRAGAWLIRSSTAQ